MASAVELQALYGAQAAYVRRALRRLGVPERDLEDVVHEVFVTVWRRLDCYDRNRPVRPWLFGILFRVACDHMRLARHAREVLCDGVEPFECIDPAPNPHEALQTREAWKRVDRALGSMDLRHKAVVVMHDVSGLSAHDIARSLAIPIKTVYSRLRNGRARFHLAMDDKTPAPEPAPSAKAAPLRSKPRSR